MYELVLHAVNVEIRIRIYDVVLYEFVWDRKQRKPVSSKDRMIIVQQQSSQGEFDEK